MEMRYGARSALLKATARPSKPVVPRRVPHPFRSWLRWSSVSQRPGSDQYVHDATHAEEQLLIEYQCSLPGCGEQQVHHYPVFRTPFREARHVDVSHLGS